MVEAVAVTVQAVHLVDMAFSENGKPLVAGRSPVYGMERPNIENTPDSAPGKDIRYALAPMPLRFTDAVHTSDFHFDLFPTVIGRACAIDVDVTLTSASAAMDKWITSGIPDGWSTRAWAPELTGPAPKAFKAVLVRYEGSGTANRVAVDSVDLLPEQPARLRLDLPAPAGTTMVAIEMPGLRFLLGLNPVNGAKTVWPRGTPAALAERKPPVEAAAPKKKTASWKFWQRGG